MYKLMIVDDEHMIVDWLYSQFEDLQGRELDVYKAGSGQEAVDLLNRMRMDVVLTDIRMPGMSGLQLLDIIKRNWPQCKVIFLTGYNEFDYIYTAVKHDGVSFLLKTEKDAEIVRAVEKALDEIDSSSRNLELIERARRQLGRAMPLLQREYLSALLGGYGPALTASQRQLDELEIPLNAALPVMLLLGRIDLTPGKLTQVEKSRRLHTVRGLAEQCFPADYPSACLLSDDCHMAWLIQPAPPPAAPGDVGWERAVLFVRESLETIQKVCANLEDAPVSFAMAGLPVEWTGVPDKAQELKRLLDGVHGYESGMILFDRAGPAAGAKGPDDAGRPLRAAGIPINTLTTMENCLNRGQRKEFLELYSGIAEVLSAVKSMRSLAAREIHLSLALLLLSYINRCGISEKLARSADIGSLAKTDDFDCWKDASDSLLGVARAIFDLQEIEKDNRTTDAVSVVRDHILAHLSEGISLARLSELVYFNPSYLSRIFKQATGMSITEYIQSVRLGRAKDLLSRNDQKIQEIASALGFESPAYFAKFFKKMTGLTPQDYRNSFIGA